MMRRRRCLLISRKNTKNSTCKPSILTVPVMNYIAVSGHGDPNQEDGEYKQAIGLLYGIALTDS